MIDKAISISLISKYVPQNYKIKSTERTCTELGEWEPTETGDQKFNSILSKII